MDDYISIKEYTPKTREDYLDFFKFIIRCWDENYGRAILGRKYLTLITGGWSENESILSAVEQNRYMQACWESSKRGGWYRYELPNK